MAEPLHSPARLAITDQGFILVSEPGRRSVAVLDGASLEVRERIAIRGKPLGVAWGKGRLYVGNDTTGVVEVHARHPTGQWQHRTNLGGNRNSIPGPTDIEVDEKQGLVFVLSQGQKRVLVFTLRGRLHSTLDGNGSAGVSLENPVGIAIDPSRREVLISDYGDPATGVPAEIKIFNYEGAFLGAISGESGQEGFEFSRPQGLTVNALGQVFAADALLGQVLVFERDTLQGVKTIGGYGSGPGQLLMPLDVQIDLQSMDVLVTNNRAGRVEIFPSEGWVP